jgi:mannose/fructose/N-acetylgalactosamine-specific phosphotransferase system component IID
MLVGWFLILWGVTFFFSAIWGLLDLSGYSVGFLIIEVLWDLAELAIAGVLAILGLKVLGGDCLSFLDST